MNIQLLKELVEKGFSQHKIAKEMCVCQTTVRYYLRKHHLYTSRTLDKNNTNPVRKRCYTKCNICKSECSKYSTICFKCWEKNRRIVSIDKAKTRPTLKRILIESRGYKCDICKTLTWNDLPISLELHHIDGNSDNNKEENLLILCPNCHSQTDTYKSKNKVASETRRKHRQTKEFKVL